MRQPLSEQQVLQAVAIVATPQGAATLLSEWLEYTVTPAEVAEVIAGSEQLRRITSFCRSVQDPSSAADDFEAKISSQSWPVARPPLPAVAPTMLNAMGRRVRLIRRGAPSSFQASSSTARSTSGSSPSLLDVSSFTCR